MKNVSLGREIDFLNYGYSNNSFPYSYAELLSHICYFSYVSLAAATFKKVIAISSAQCVIAGGQRMRWRLFLFQYSVQFHITHGSNRREGKQINEGGGTLREKLISPKTA